MSISRINAQCLIICYKLFPLFHVPASLVTRLCPPGTQPLYRHSCAPLSNRQFTYEAFMACESLPVLISSKKRLKSCLLVICIAGQLGFTADDMGIFSHLQQLLGLHQNTLP